MALNNLFLSLATALFLICLSGCKAPRRDTSDFDSMLRTVSYNTSVPLGTAPSGDAKTAPVVPIDTSSTFVERSGSLRRAVGNGLRNIAGVMLCGVFKIAKSTLGLDDDDDSAPRGKADRNFNQWLDDRDKWRSAD